MKTLTILSSLLFLVLTGCPQGTAPMNSVANPQTEVVIRPAQNELRIFTNDGRALTAEEIRFKRGDTEFIAKELNITEAQMEALRKKAEEVRTELQKKTAKLQEEAKVEILSVLTSEQRSKLDKLMGAKFEFSPPQFGQGGPGGGGPGGQGGRGRGGNAPLQRPADGD